MVDPITIDALDKDHPARWGQSCLWRGERAKRIHDQGPVARRIVRSVDHPKIAKPRIVMQQDDLAAGMVPDPLKVAIEESPEFGTV